MMNQHPRLSAFGRVGKYVADEQLKGLRLPKARAMKQERNEHVAIVIPSCHIEARRQQIHEPLFRICGGLASLDSRQALRPNPVSLQLWRGVVCPGVPEKRPVAPKLISRFVSYAVISPAGIARIHLRYCRAHSAKPVEEVSEVGDDVARILCRTRLPAKPARVQTGVPVKGPGIEPLREILKQVATVALGRIALKIFQEHP